jgi:hypothetical protein
MGIKIRHTCALIGFLPIGFRVPIAIPKLNPLVVTPVGAIPNTDPNLLGFGSPEGFTRVHF